MKSLRRVEKNHVNIAIDVNPIEAKNRLVACAAMPIDERPLTEAVVVAVLNYGNPA